MASARFVLGVPDDIQEFGLRVRCGSSVNDREALVACTVSSPDQGLHEIPRWPIYRLNGLPSKFVRANAKSAIQAFPNLELPRVDKRVLEVSLSGRKISEFTEWTAILFPVPQKSIPLYWINYFGGDNG